MNNLKHEENLLLLVKKPILTRKAYNYIRYENTIVLNVVKKAQKKQIKTAVKKYFSVEIENIRILIVKSKKCIFKKAYIKIKTGQSVNFIALK